MSDYTKYTLDEQKQQALETIKDIKDPNILLSIINSLLFLYARRAQEPLVQLLQEKGVTQQEIGDKLGVSKAAISFSFPKGGKR